MHIRSVRWSLLASLCVAVVVLVPGKAFAFRNFDPAVNPTFAADCNQCHSPTSDGGTETWDGTGPHGNYITTTNKCALCHGVHNAPVGSAVLLRGATVTATCLLCHDGTGATLGVYSTIEAHGGTVVADHSVDTVSAIPGGTTPLTAPLSCGTCHSVHAANTVQPFLRDSGHALYADEFTESDCLLRNEVNGVAVMEYGAQWCAACHNQRHSDPLLGSGVLNHPVALDSDWVYRTVVSSITNADSYHIANPFDGGTGTAVGLGRTNGAYIMAPTAAGASDGRIEEVDRKAPMCQQCHEDARDVEAIFQGDYTHEGDPVTEPWLAPVNPEFLTFPHQTTQAGLLVESVDDLCLNCHPMANG